MPGDVQKAVGCKAPNFEEGFGPLPSLFPLPPSFNHTLNLWPSGLYSSYWEGKEGIFDGGNGVCGGGAFLSQTNAYTVPAC